MPLDDAGFWRFRPREQRLDAFYGGPADPQNPWGFVWTDWGQMLMVAGNNGGIYWPLPEMIRGVAYGKRDKIWVNARGRKTSGPDIVGTAHLPARMAGRASSPAATSTTPSGRCGSRTTAPVSDLAIAECRSSDVGRKRPLAQKS